MLMLGAKQRSEEQFRRLLSDADPRLKVSLSVNRIQVARY